MKLSKGASSSVLMLRLRCSIGSSLVLKGEVNSVRVLLADTSFLICLQGSWAKAVQAKDEAMRSAARCFITDLLSTKSSDLLCNMQNKIV